MSIIVYVKNILRSCFPLLAACAFLAFDPLSDRGVPCMQINWKARALLLRSGNCGAGLERKTFGSKIACCKRFHGTARPDAMYDAHAA